MSENDGKAYVTKRDREWIEDMHKNHILVNRKDLQRKIILPYERLLKYSTEDETVAITKMREDLKSFKEKYKFE